jgi:hypothetical protein
MPKVISPTSKIATSILALLIFPTFTALAEPGRSFGQIKEENGAQIYLKLNRRNISGLDFHLTLPGLCLYDDGEFVENTFSFGGENFPDLFVNRSLRVNSEFEATSDSGHVGNLQISCRFIEVNNRIRRARCSTNFYSPARPEEQLDYCSGEQTFARIVRGQ